VVIVLGPGLILSRQFERFLVLIRFSFGSIAKSHIEFTCSLNGTRLAKVRFRTQELKFQMSTCHFQTLCSCRQ
jgi:hypothetical protein